MQNVKAARALNITAARVKKTPFTVHRYNGNGNFFMTPTVHHDILANLAIKIHIAKIGIAIAIINVCIH